MTFIVTHFDSILWMNDSLWETDLFDTSHDHIYSKVEFLDFLHYDVIGENTQGSENGITRFSSPDTFPYQNQS